MTPAEAIAALEAAYPEYEYAVCENWSTVWQRLRSGVIAGEAKISYSISFFPKECHPKIPAVGGETVQLAFLAAMSSLPLTQTQRTIEKVAAGLTDEALMKRP